jgi:hypothetical protein
MMSFSDMVPILCGLYEMFLGPLDDTKLGPKKE